MKGVGMLVVSLKGINLRFWSHLGCSGQNAIIFSREGLVQGLNSKFPTSIPTFHMRSPSPGPKRSQKSLHPKFFYLVSLEFLKVGIT